MTTNQDTGATVETAADPTVVAAAEYEAEAVKFNKVSTKFDEDTPEFRGAQERILQAGERLAKAPVTSFAGAAIKARKLGDAEKIEEETHGFSFHEFRTLLAFLDRNTGGPSAPADPTLIAKAETDTALAVHKKTDEDKDEAEYYKTQETWAAAEKRLFAAPISSLAGAAVKVRYVLDELKDGFGEDAHIPALETLSAFLDGLVCGDVPAPHVADPSVPATPAIESAPTLSDLERAAADTRIKLKEEMADPKRKDYLCVIRSLEIMVAYLDRRVSEGATTDPTIAALDAYFIAVRRYNDFDEEDSPEFKEANEQWGKSLDWMEKVLITAPAGAAAYALFLEYEHVGETEEEYSDARCIKHFRAQLDRLAAAEPVKTEPHDIRSMVNEMDGHLTRAESHTDALGTLIEYVNDPLDPEARELREVMYWVQNDIEIALVKARRGWRDLHEATRVPAREKADA